MSKGIAADEGLKLLQGIGQLELDIKRFREVIRNDSSAVENIGGIAAKLWFYIETSFYLQSVGEVEDGVKTKEEIKDIKACLKAIRPALMNDQLSQDERREEIENNEDRLTQSILNFKDDICNPKKAKSMEYLLPLACFGKISEKLDGAVYAAAKKVKMGSAGDIQSKLSGSTVTTVFEGLTVGGRVDSFQSDNIAGAGGQHSRDARAQGSGVVKTPHSGAAKSQHGASTRNQHPISPDPKRKNRGALPIVPD